jgi:hypothetical protein
MSFKFPCDGKSWPFYIYVAISVIGLLLAITSGMPASVIVSMLLWSIFWGTIIYLVGAYCHNTAAWILLFLPIILWLIGMFIIFSLFGLALGGLFAGLAIAKK